MSTGTQPAGAPLRREALIGAMAEHFGEDARRIAHARRVVEYAEMTLAEEEADRDVVLAAAALHDIGIRNAEGKYGSSSARYQHAEGPPVAEAILRDLGCPDRFVEEVCDIVGHHHSPREGETPNFSVVYDADLLTDLEEAGARGAARSFLTAAGRAIAGRVGLDA